jgi:hypothetical protein
MANLICAVDPWCELYVAKVSEGRSGITAGRVAQVNPDSLHFFKSCNRASDCPSQVCDDVFADRTCVKAVEWAILNEVDIISMSFAILDDKIPFRAACAAAADAGIVMFCSSHDEGYPSYFNDTITVNACDEFGEPLQAAKNIDYSIRGRDVPAGVVPFLESSGSITGSSVSTAIAAGLGSLILSCQRLANPEKTYAGRSSRRDIIKARLSTMAPDQNKKSYILLEKFGGIDQRIKDGTDINVDDVLQKFRIDVR